MTGSDRTAARLAILVGLALAGLRVASGGTIEVVIRERGGAPLAKQFVVHYPPPPTSGAPTRWWTAPGYRERRGLTGPDGRVVFPDLRRGSYTITLPRPSRPFVAPHDNPFAPAPTVTLLEDTDHITVTLDLWRGIGIWMEVLVDRGEPPPGEVVFHEIQQGFRRTSVIDRSGQGERYLVPGLWEVFLEPPSGYLLVGFERDGQPLPGHRTTLDLLNDPRDTFLTWRFRAPCELEGRVVWDEDPPGRLLVRASLLEAGPWMPEIQERGGSHYAEIEAFPNQHGRYAMVLPDGAWLVRPAGDRVISSDPESVELHLQTGEVARADFSVRIEPEDGKGGGLWVRVTSPEGVRLPGAHVGVFRLSNGKLTGEPLRRVKGELDGGWIKITGLPAGDLLVAAAHREYVEGTTRVEQFDPGKEKPRFVRVRLGRGATILARASDTEDTPVEGVTLDLELLERDEPPLLDDPELEADRRSRQAHTDVTGIAVLSGLAVGLYHLGSHLDGPAAATAFTRLVHDGGKPVEELELRLAADVEEQLALRVLPAGSLAGALVCTEGGALPLSASFRVLSALGSTDAEGSHLEEDVRADTGDNPGGGESEPVPVLTLDRANLAGPLRDRFQVGPLEAGVYHLAARPAGFEVWTWALGTEDRSRAAAVQVNTGEETDLGVIEVVCGPVILIAPPVAREHEAFDLRRGTVTAEASHVLEDGKRQTWTLERRLERHHARLSVAPDGEVDLHVELDHPHLLGPPRSWDFTLELQRGRIARLEPHLGALGGAIEVLGAGAAAAVWGPGGGDRAVRNTEPTLIQTMHEGTSYLRSLPVGLYRVAFCAGVSCKTLLAVEDAVEVRPGRDTIVDFSSLTATSPAP